MRNLLHKLAEAIAFLYPNASISEIDDNDLRIYFTTPYSTSKFHAQIELYDEQVVVYEKKIEDREWHIWLGINTLSFTDINEIYGKIVFEYKEEN